MYRTIEFPGAARMAESDMVIRHKIRRKTTSKGGASLVPFGF